MTKSITFVLTFIFSATFLYANGQTCSSDSDCGGQLGSCAFGSCNLGSSSSTTSMVSSTISSTQVSQLSQSSQSPTQPTNLTTVSTSANCPNLQGGNACLNGGQCVTDGSASYCICTQQYGGLLCQILVTQAARDIASQPPSLSQLTVMNNSMFVDKAVTDGTTSGRYAVSSINDCLNLCANAGLRCASFNFGTLNGQQVCQLISIRQSADNPLLQSWIEPGHPGWSYVCCLRNKVSGVFT